MLDNIWALTSVLSYLDESESTRFGEDSNWNHVYLNALILDEEFGMKIMKKPIGAWVKPFGDGDKYYIDLSNGPNRFVDFQDILREGDDNNEPITVEEVVYQ